MQAPSDLGSHECLRILGSTVGPSPWTLSRAAQIETVEVRGRFVANGMRFLLELATMGLGVAVLDAALGNPAVDDGRLVRVLPAWSPPPVPVHAITPSRLLLSRTKTFLDCLSDHLRIEDSSDRAKAPAGPSGAQ
jgi:DNA-binding transcriptional LysR family regulator